MHDKKCDNTPILQTFIHRFTHLGISRMSIRRVFVSSLLLATSPSLLVYPHNIEINVEKIAKVYSPSLIDPPLSFLTKLDLIPFLFLLP